MTINMLRNFNKKKIYKIVRQWIAPVLLGLIFLFATYALFRERHLIYLFQPAAPTKAQIACDDFLWSFNAEHEDIIQPCISFSGTVVHMHAEKDGDENIQIKPDPGYTHLLNFWNIVGQWGNIAAEPICEHHPSRKSFIKACKGYHSIITLPHVGDHVLITGSYGTDKHKWTEIHPVTNITILPK